MDYSNVTSEDLHDFIRYLSERLENFDLERRSIANQIDTVHEELVRRNQGTTDDSAEWQDVGIK